MTQMILALSAACKIAGHSLEKLETEKTDSNSINIPTESFDLIGPDNNWQGKLTIFASGKIMVEKGGKHNWIDRYASIYEFRKAMANKKIA